MTNKTNQVHNQPAIENLNELRRKTVTTISFISMFAILLMAVFRFVESNHVLVGIDLVCITILALSIYWARQGQLNLALVSSCFTLLTISFIVSFFQWTEPIFVIPNIALFTAIYITILKHQFHKIAFVILTLIIVGLISFKLNYQASQIGIFIVQLFFFFLCFEFFTSYLTQQDAHLQSVIYDQKSLNQEISLLNNNLVSKNNELETLNHIMSHDLKAPLRTIGSFTQLLKRNANKNEPLKTEAFDYIEDSVKDMSILIEDLLQFFKVDKEGNSLKEVSLSELIKSIQTIYQFEINNNKLVFEVQNLL